MQQTDDSQASWYTFPKYVGQYAFFPTTQITEPNLAGLATLIYCPMIFQEMIPKAYELRIVYVDGEFLPEK